MRPIIVSFTKTLILCSILLVAIYSTTTIYAQFEDPTKGISFTLKPQYPEPYNVVRVSINAYSASMQGASILWFVDGVEINDARNNRSVDVFVEGLGSSKSLKVQIVSNGIIIGEVKKTITPSLTDIIIEADTTIPIFYEGRSLPSQGSEIRVIAVPHTKTGSLSNYSYKWELNGKILFGGAIRGKQSAIFTVPKIGKPIITLTVSSANGNIISKKNLRLGVVKPELYFYKENPLRSTGRKAIVGPLTLITNEATVSAEPYFFNKDIFNVGQYKWRLDGEEIETGNSNPKLITLRQTGGSGTATVGFELINTKNLLQSVKKTFNVVFNEVSSNN